MSAILTTLIGGLLAIYGGLVGIALTDRRERTRWMRDSQLQASINLLSALQLLVRRMINVAYLDPQVWADQESLDPGKRRDKDPQSSGTVAAFVEATVAWNNALYRALLIAPPSVAAKIPDLDREVDRLVDLAVAGAGRGPSSAKNAPVLAGWQPSTCASLAVSRDYRISSCHRSGPGTPAT